MDDRKRSAALRSPQRAAAAAGPRSTPPKRRNHVDDAADDAPAAPPTPRTTWWGAQVRALIGESETGGLDGRRERAGGAREAPRALRHERRLPLRLLRGRLVVDGAVRQGEVAVYCAYENTEDVYEIDEAALCSKKINLCGVKATPPCYKRHVQKVPVTSLRPPAAFQMLEIETATTDGRERHRFRLPPDVLPAARAAIAEDEARFPAAVLY